MNEQDITSLRALALARSSMLAARQQLPVTQAIIAATALAFGIAPEDIASRSRSKSIAEARAVVCYVARRCTRMSFPQIGKALDRDHTTVMSAVQRVEQRRSRDRWTDSACSVLLEQFGEIEEAKTQ